MKPPDDDLIVHPHDADLVADHLYLDPRLAEQISTADAATLTGFLCSRVVVRTGYELKLKGPEAAGIEAHLDAARRAAAKIDHDGDARALTKEERKALELFILLVERPALFVLGSKVHDPPDNWSSLRAGAAMIERRIAGVGRIELAPGGKGRAVGTGVIVADRRIVTNNHVVAALAGLRQPGRWRVDRQMFAEAVAWANAAWPTAPPRFDLIGEFQSSTTNTTSITRVVAHHPERDLAVLELASQPTGAVALPLAATPPGPLDDRIVAAIGYPVAPNEEPDPVIARIFGGRDALATKRFSPGRVLSTSNGHQLDHDASTLPGSSGSAIIDLDSYDLLAIHFAGWYKDRNAAVALWDLADELTGPSDPVFGAQP